MVCTCLVVCHGVYLLSCVSWCVLVCLCVMVKIGVHDLNYKSFKVPVYYTNWLIDIY